MQQNDSILDDIHPTETEAPYGRRALVNIIDAVIELLMIIAFYVLMPRDLLVHLFNERPFMKYMIALSLVFMYRFLCIFIAGKTAGMAICKTKYLNSHHQPLSAIQKITAVFAIRTAGIKYYKV